MSSDKTPKGLGENTSPREFDVHVILKGGVLTFRVDFDTCTVNDLKNLVMDDRRQYFDMDLFVRGRTLRDKDTLTEATVFPDDMLLYVMKQ